LAARTPGAHREIFSSNYLPPPPPRSFVRRHWPTRVPPGPRRRLSVPGLPKGSSRNGLRRAAGRCRARSKCRVASLAPTAGPIPLVSQDMGTHFAIFAHRAKIDRHHPGRPLRLAARFTP
jgi:hypothetical protein